MEPTPRFTLDQLVSPSQSDEAELDELIADAKKKTTISRLAAFLVVLVVGALVAGLVSWLARSDNEPFQKQESRPEVHGTFEEIE